VAHSKRGARSNDPGDEGMTTCDKVLGELEKKKEKNKKTQGKGIIDRSIFVLVIKTLKECDHI
jgi:hypothetical protein